ncbi:hypothetical protein ACGFMM_25115 [Streptomyces sp. NPDC048604]|uniref:hypothetical protein n=1 Tax=Streptomyces sp. NPDC048604 TaxID=3365578 RepID=UPI0037167A00
MAEVAGARAELRRFGESLLAQVRAVAEHVTPAVAIPDSALPDLPEVAEWTDPLRYRFSLREQTSLPAGVCADEAVRRAFETLAAGGFDITEERGTAIFGARIVVTGSRDGFWIKVRVWPDTGDVVYAGVTPMLALLEPQAPLHPDPVRTREMVERGNVLCYECDGLGWCPGCGGLGWVLDDAGLRRRCPECREQRVCPICRGSGQLPTEGLRRTERAFYPELADPPVRQDES